MEPEHDQHDDRRVREPFWAAFRRRRPDVDVVLLPPEHREEPGDARYDEPTVVATAAEEAEAVVDALWAACTTEGDEVTAHPTARWTHGPRKGVVRREVSRVREGAEPVSAALAVDRGAATLREQGWTVIEPTDGVPRVLASRGDGARQEEALVLTAPDTGRVVVRYRSGGLVVPRAAARRLVSGGAS